MKLRSFESHGLNFGNVKQNAVNASSICPFCLSIYNGAQKEGKFNVQRQTGVWQCFHCKRKGNLTSFLEQLYDHWLVQTTEEDYQDLADQRPGIRAQDLREHKLAFNRNTGRWLIPCKTRRDTIFNLYTYQPGSHAFGTAGIPHGLFGMETIQPNKPIFLVEGPWSRLALLRLLKGAKVKGIVLGVPGAVFKQDWCDLFIGQSVYVVCDNDTAGMEETERAIQHITTHTNGKPKSLYRIQWPSTAPPKWDPRDLIHHELDELHHTASSVWKDFTRLLVPATYSEEVVEDPEEEEPLPVIKSFTRVVKEFKGKGIYLNPNMVDGLAVMLAIAVSSQLAGSPLWAFIVGPPGSGKTLTLEGFGRYKNAVYRSSIRATELISGWLTEDGTDPSLIPKIQGKTLVLKDYTEVMSMAQMDQEILYGVLRGAYDGRAERFFANGLERVYHHCWFNMIAGVTDDIKAHNRASLGERFIRFQWSNSEDCDRSTHITAAIRGIAKQVETERYLAGIIAGFLTGINLEESKMPPIESWFETRIVALVQILAHLRARVNIERNGEISHRPTIEIGTRPAIQFCKLAQCVAVVLGKKRIDMAIYSLIERVFRDTCESWSLDIFEVLLSHDPELVTKDTIEREARIPSTTAFRRLEQMEALGTITRVKTPVTQFGRPPYSWRLSDEIRALVTQAKLKPVNR
jgi:predicted transcriptional regulator